MNKRRRPPDADRLLIQALGDLVGTLREQGEVLRMAMAEVRRLRRARRHLTRTIIRLVEKALARKRKPADVAGDEELRRLHDEGGRSYAWIARRRGLTRETVRSAVRRARKRS